MQIESRKLIRRYAIEMAFCTIVEAEECVETAIGR